MKRGLSWIVAAVTFAAVAKLQGIDTNSDGMSDVWQQKYSVPSTDANVDYVGNGFTNLQKSGLGLNPHDPNSRFHSELMHDVPNNELHLRIDTAFAKLYQIEFTTDFITWEATGPVITGDGTTMDVVTTWPDESISALSLRSKLVGDVDGDSDGYTGWEEHEIGSSDGDPDSPVPQPTPTPTPTPTATPTATPTPTAAPSPTPPTNPNGDDDCDGKTNEQEYNLSSDPNVFQVFFQQQFGGYEGVGEHTDSKPESYVFYTQTMQVPEEWKGLSYSAKIQFDQTGTFWNWLVDDFASLNGQQFLQYGRAPLTGPGLVFDVTSQWNFSVSGTNTVTATSNEHPDVSIQSFKEVLILTPSVQIVPDAGVDGHLGGMIKGTKEIEGDKCFQKHFVSPTNLTDNPNYTPDEDYVTFVAQGATAEQFDKNYKWDTTVGEAVSGDKTKWRVRRTQAGKYPIRILLHDSGTEIAKLNVWVVKADVNPDPSATPSQPKVVFNMAGFSLRATNAFIHTITPQNILTDPDRPDLTATTTGAPGTNPCKNLNTGVDHLWDASRQVSVQHTNSAFSLTLLSCADQQGTSYPSGSDANIVGNDDERTADENNVPGSSSNLKSNDAPARVVKNNEGGAGDFVQFDLRFREFTRLKVGNTWYRISRFYPWKVSFVMRKNASGAWTKDNASILVNNAN